MIDYRAGTIYSTVDVLLKWQIMEILTYKWEVANPVVGDRFWHLQVEGFQEVDHGTHEGNVLHGRNATVAEVQVEHLK